MEDSVISGLVSSPGVNERTLSAVRGRLSLQLDAAITNPFSTEPNRGSLIREAIATALTELDETGNLTAHLEEIYNELVGLGPLQSLMEDPLTTDVLVNRFDEIYIEREGKLQPTNVRFRDTAHLEQLISKIVALVGREISVDKPVVDARMVDGSRANAVFAPVGGPSLCIRKFNRLRLALDSDEENSWTQSGGMSAEMAVYLREAALARANLLIAGATGAGKSTLLRSIVDAFPRDERIITIEDTAELELDNPHWVRLECVHHHELGSGNDSSARRLDVADLVHNALRMRPDRLIIGEIRNSREAYHTLEALNTGHDGSATTIHASGAEDALSRLELLLGRSFGHLSPSEIRGHIARVFDVIVFVTRLRSGRRCVTDICELSGCGPNGEYDLRPVFRAEMEHEGTGMRPRFLALRYQMGPRLLRKRQLQGLA